MRLQWPYRFRFRRSCLPSWAARSCRSRRPVGRAAIGQRSSPGRIRAGRPARTRPPRGHSAGERRTRRRRYGRVDPGAPPRAARGVDRFRVGWPPIELRLAWRGGFDALADRLSRAGSSRLSRWAVRSVLGRCELEEVALDDPVPSAVATRATRFGRATRSFVSTRRAPRRCRCVWRSRSIRPTPAYR